MKTSSTPVASFAAFVLFFGWLPAAHAITLFSNLGQPISTSVQLFTTSERNASDFMTGNAETTVTGVTFSLLNQDTVPHTLTASIYTDSAGVPGSLVGTFDPGLSVTPLDATWANHSTTASGIALAANTPYWLVLSLDQNGTFNYVNWSVSGFATSDAVTGFSTIGATQIKHSINGGGSYTNAVSGSAMFELSGVVPEPGKTSCFILALAAIVCIRRRP